MSPAFLQSLSFPSKEALRIPWLGHLCVSFTKKEEILKKSSVSAHYDGKLQDKLHAVCYGIGSDILENSGSNVGGVKDLILLSTLAPATDLC